MLNESSLIHLAQARKIGLVSKVNGQWKRLILLLLLVSGNVQLNPGPIFNNIGTPEEYIVEFIVNILKVIEQQVFSKETD